MSAPAVTRAIRESRLVAILRGSRTELLVTGSQTLAEEGIRVLEFPLTRPEVLDAISAASATLQGRAYVGAGTVRTVEDARRAVDAGASFLVSPGLSIAVIDFALAHDVAVLPGTFTPTEIDLAQQAGAELVKLFPATAHDPEFLRQILVPMPLAGVVPTGGVDLKDAPAWLGAGAVALGVGSPLTGDSLETGDLDQFRHRVRAWRAALS